jgi:hypothetical protein
LGRKHSAASVAAEVCASPAGASAGRAQPAPEGSGHRLGAGAADLRPGPKGSECQSGAGLARGVPQQNRWRDRASGSQCRLCLLSLATQLLERGQDIRTIQELLCHQDVGITMTYTPVLNRGPHGVRSPAGILVSAEQMVLGPVNWRYLWRAFGKARGGTGNLRGWPTGCISGSRKGPAGRLWVSEPSNKELEDI